ncbi:MAG: hypothetical protein ACFFC1_21920 [Promethearchaeota archaeon]
MKKHNIKFFILIFIFKTIVLSQNVELGFISGYNFPQGDFGTFWHGFPSIGVSFTYPFHKKFPIIYSGLISYHKPIDRQPVKKGYNKPSQKILLGLNQISTQYKFVENTFLTPIFLFGVSVTTFLPYTKWPPAPNASESEIGILTGTGLKAQINNKISLDLTYNENIAFTEPRFVYYGLLLLQFRFVMEKISIRIKKYIERNESEKK